MATVTDLPHRHTSPDVDLEALVFLRRKLVLLERLNWSMVDAHYAPDDADFEALADLIRELRDLADQAVAWPPPKAAG